MSKLRLLLTLSPISLRLIDFTAYFRYSVILNLPSNGQSKRREMATEVEEIIKRIQSHRGVTGIIVVNNDGIPIKTTLDNSTTVQCASLIHSLTLRARNTVRDLDPSNDLKFIRIRSRKNEIMCAPDKEFLLIVIQQDDLS